MDITGPQLNQPMQQYQWKNQPPMFGKSSVQWNYISWNILCLEV